MKKYHSSKKLRFHSLHPWPPKVPEIDPEKISTDPEIEPWEEREDSPPPPDFDPSFPPEKNPIPQVPEVLPPDQN